MAGQLEAGTRAAALEQTQVGQNYGRDRVDPTRFPDAARLFAADIREPPPEDPDANFAFGLELVLDGVAAAVGRAHQQN
ncbi:hypothetical protein [Nocardia nepalensis]|uniref:hypothetical protein n=1 Tax=Nocardia nepalensis TaxID=3375448 RepID=UPI003B67866B